MKLAIAHDYLTQRGGAERVVLAMARVFPDADVYTSLYDPSNTFPEFADLRVHVSPLDRLHLLRHRHRLALPLLAPAFSQMRIDADVLLCSSSGWAHGATTTGRKVVYCHAPARWLYQPDRYLEGAGAARRTALAVLAGPLRRWDRRAADSADRYVVNSRAVRDNVRSLYGIDASVLPPPPGITPDGPERPVEGVEPGFYLCVARLLVYKNVRNVVKAFARRREEQLVVVGSGPQEAELRSDLPPNVRIETTAADAEMRWLYRNCAGLIGAAYEDFGLTPVEAAGFGKPTAALRFGGYLDTVVEGHTGIFFDEPDPDAIAVAVGELARRPFDEAAIRQRAEQFSEEQFQRRLLEAVASEGDI